MEPAITKDKHYKPVAAARLCRARLFLIRTVLAPAFTLALLLYARSSLPKLLSCALEYTSKEAMFFFCNSILLFLAKGSTLFVRPLPLCPAAADDEDRGHPSGSRKSGYGTGGQQAVPETVMAIRGAVVLVGAKVKGVVVIEQEQEQEQQGQEAEGAALREVEAGDMFEEDASGEWYVQREDEVEEEDNCSLSPEELKKKADEFIENFKRQRSFEAMQLVAAR